MPALTHEELDAAAQDKAFKDAIFWGKVPGCLPLCGACSKFGFVGADANQSSRTKCLTILVVMNIISVACNLIGFMGLFQAPMVNLPWASYKEHSLVFLTQFPASTDFGGVLANTTDICEEDNALFNMWLAHDSEFFRTLPGLDGLCSTCTEFRDYDITTAPPTCAKAVTDDIATYYMNPWGICMVLEADYKWMKVFFESQEPKTCWTWDEFSTASTAVVESHKNDDPLVYAGYQAIETSFGKCKDSATGMEMMLYIGIIIPLLVDVILYTQKLVKGEGRTDPDRDWGCKNKFMGMLSPLIPLIMNGGALGTFQSACYDGATDGMLGVGYWCTLAGFLIGFPRAIVHLLVKSRDLRDAKPRDQRDGKAPSAGVQLSKAAVQPEGETAAATATQA